MGRRVMCRARNCYGKSSVCLSVRDVKVFIYLFKNSTQYKQYKIEDTIKAVEF